MALKKPSSMDECIYFTNRIIDNGKIMAWVFKKECPKCKKGVMGKPLKKGNKIDKKADHYVCYSCGYTEGNEQMENSLVLNVEYKCPHCGHEGEATTEYQRKSFYGVKAYIFSCQKCGQKMGITQKLKEPKKKAAKTDEEDVGED